MAAAFTPEQIEVLETWIQVHVGMLSGAFRQLMQQGKTQVDALTEQMAKHEAELHRSADAARALVELVNEKSAMIEQLKATDSQLADLTTSVGAFAERQESEIKGQAGKLEQLTREIESAIQAVDSKMQAAVVQGKDIAIREITTLRQELQSGPSG